MAIFSLLLGGGGGGNLSLSPSFELDMWQAPHMSLLQTVY